MLAQITKRIAFRSLGALAMLVTSSAALLQPTAAMAQDRDGDYGRNRWVQQDRGYGDHDFRRDRDFRRERDFRRDDDRDFRRQQWLAEERREQGFRNRERWEREHSGSAFYFGFGGRPDCR